MARIIERGASEARDEPLGELSDYEKDHIAAIKAWKLEEPGVVSKALGIITHPITWLFEMIIPKAAIQGALDAANWTAVNLTDRGDIIRDGCVNQICDLKNKSLRVSDDLADNVHN